MPVRNIIWTEFTSPW